MNAHARPTAAEPADGESQSEWTKQRVNMRSLALNLRKHSHRHRQWARESADLGKTVAAQGFAATAQKYASDALWYWMRAKQEGRS
jgi:hypothetical protein